MNDYRRYFDDAHVTATGAVSWVEHAQIGRIPLHRIPGLPSPAPGSPATRSPAVGQHTREILAEAGLSPDDIATLEATGTVRSPSPTTLAAD